MFFKSRVGLGCSGYCYDGASGKVVQNLHRFYDPHAGRYINHDPIGLMGGLNQYQYCPNPVGWVDPLGLSCKESDSTPLLEASKKAAQLRNSPGTAYGQGVDVGDNWLKGSHGNAGLTPKQVADKLRGQSFNNFNDFRAAYWKAVADTPELASQFSQRNVTRMSNGNSPFTHPTQSLGGRGVYELHHRTPINQGGAVYTVDNIMVTSPRYHKEVLDPIYHFSR